MENVQDFQWKGIALSNSRGMGFRLQNCSNVRIQQARVSGFAGQAGVILPPAFIFLLTACSVTSYLPTFDKTASTCMIGHRAGCRGWH